MPALRGARRTASGVAAGGSAVVQPGQSAANKRSGSVQQVQVCVGEGSLLGSRERVGMRTVNWLARPSDLHHANASCVCACSASTYMPPQPPSQPFVPADLARRVDRGHRRGGGSDSFAAEAVTESLGLLRKFLQDPALPAGVGNYMMHRIEAAASFE